MCPRSLVSPSGATSPVSSARRILSLHSLPCFNADYVISNSVDVTTSDPVVQVYSGNGLNIPRKKIHGGPSLNYSQYSAIVVEQEGYIAGINNPEWGQDQICE